jgi:hypothetical protein
MIFGHQFILAFVDFSVSVLYIRLLFAGSVDKLDNRTSRSAAALTASALGMSGSTVAPPRRGRGPWPRSSGKWLTV